MIATQQRNFDLKLQKAQQNKALRSATKVLHARWLDSAIHIALNASEVTDYGSDGKRFSEKVGLRLGDHQARYSAWRTEGGLGRGASGVAHRGRARISVLSVSFKLLAPSSLRTRRENAVALEGGAIAPATAKASSNRRRGALEAPIVACHRSGDWDANGADCVARRPRGRKPLPYLWDGAENPLTPFSQDFFDYPLPLFYLLGNER
jgi:hypothetical protein